VPSTERLSYLNNPEIGNRARILPTIAIVPPTAATLAATCGGNSGTAAICVATSAASGKIATSPPQKVVLFTNAFDAFAINAPSNL